MGVILLTMPWVIHYHYIGVCSVSGHFSGAVIKQNSRTQNHWKSEPAKEEVLAFYCILLIDTSHFHISNFTIVFGILRNLFPVKMAWINRWQAEKCWHFLFAERNSEKEATYNYTIVFCISWNPWKRHGSINKRQKNADTSGWASETESDEILKITIV